MLRCQRGCRCCSTSSIKTIPRMSTGVSLRREWEVRRNHQDRRSRIQVTVERYPSPREDRLEAAPATPHSYSSACQFDLIPLVEL